MRGFRIHVLPWDSLLQPAQSSEWPSFLIGYEIVQDYTGTVESFEKKHFFFAFHRQNRKTHKTTRENEFSTVMRTVAQDIYTNVQLVPYVMARRGILSPYSYYGGSQ